MWLCVGNWSAKLSYASLGHQGAEHSQHACLHWWSILARPLVSVRWLKDVRLPLHSVRLAYPSSGALNQSMISVCDLFSQQCCPLWSGILAGIPVVSSRDNIMCPTPYTGTLHYAISMPAPSKEHRGWNIKMYHVIKMNFSLINNVPMSLYDIVRSRWSC